VNTPKRQVEPIRDLVHDLDPYTDIVLYLAGSEKGARPHSSDAHGFGIVITFNGRIGRVGFHSSDSEGTTFIKAYLGSLMTSLEWVRDNLSNRHVTIRSNAEYVWLNAGERLTHWEAEGRLNDNHKNKVDYNELWQKIYDLLQSMKTCTFTWGKLETKHDKDVHAKAMEIARWQSLTIRGGSQPPGRDLITPLLMAEDEFDEEMLNQEAAQHAVDRDDKLEARRDAR
jgi:ribonuclease HI